MKVFKLAGPQVFRIEATRDEVLAIDNALNEVCHSLEIKDFATRMAFPIEEVRMLLPTLHAAL